MLRHVECDQRDGLLGLEEPSRPGVFPFEVRLLILGKTGAHPLEPGVDGGLVDALLDMTALVQERHDRLVLDRLVDRVDVDDAPELGGGVLLGLENRRAGEAQIAGVREDLAHSGMQPAVLPAMALVDQQEDVLRRVGEVADVQGRVELVDEGGDDGPFLGCHEIEQIPTRGGALGLEAARLECALELFV